MNDWFCSDKDELIRFDGLASLRGSVEQIAAECGTIENFVEAAESASVQEMAACDPFMEFIPDALGAEDSSYVAENNSLDAGFLASELGADVMQAFCDVMSTPAEQEDEAIVPNFMAAFAGSPEPEIEAQAQKSLMPLEPIDDDSILYRDQVQKQCRPMELGLSQHRRKTREQEDDVEINLNEQAPVPSEPGVSQQRPSLDLPDNS